MIYELLIGFIVSLSFLVGYIIRTHTGKEVENFFKDFNKFKILKKYQIVRVFVYGILMSFLSYFGVIQYSLIIFTLGIIEGGALSSKNVKKVAKLSLLFFIIFFIFITINLIAIE